MRRWPKGRPARTSPHDESPPTSLILRTSPEHLIEEYTAKGWWGERTLNSLFQDAVKAHPQRIALVDPPNKHDLVGCAARRLSYEQLDDQVELLSAQLHAHGVRADHMVVIQLPNIAELAIVYLAAARLGAIVSPVPVQYGRHELTRIREELNADAFVAVRNFKGQDLLTDHGVAFEGCTLFSLASAAGEGAVDLDHYELTAGDQEDYAAYVAGLTPSGNDIFSICWTSGTSGTPKGVPRSFNHWLAISLSSGDLADLHDDDALLNPFPMVNMGGIGGFLFNWLKCQGKLVLHHPMDLQVFLQQLVAEKINYTIAPPALLNMLLQNKQLLESLDLSALRAIGSGSAPLSPWMVEGYENDYGIDILNNFGSNEGMCLASSPKDVPDPALRGELFPRFGIEGYEWSNRVADTVKTRLVDPDTNQEITEPGIPGELLFAGPTIFDGYWNAPDVNASVFSDDGFFHTGDLFEIADPGNDPRFYRFVGRHKDIISRGGMKISPAELDNLLAGHPKVADVAVVGVPDARLGEKVAAVVVPAPNETVELEDIIGFLKAADVAVFKLPEKLLVVDSLPRNPVGKVLRHELTPLFEGQ